MILFGRVETLCADITEMDCDAVVNAANSSLLGGGGVDGAIHRAAGPSLLEACRKIRADEYPSGLPSGEAVATGAGEMKCSYVIHTVGPVWQGGASGEPEKLASCYRNSLALAEQLKLKSLAFPAISTGVYGYPAQKAAEVVQSTLAEAVPRLKSVKKIYLVFFSSRGEEEFLSVLSEPDGGGSH